MDYCDIVFFSSRRRHTRYWRDWSSDVCSSDLRPRPPTGADHMKDALGTVQSVLLLGGTSEIGVAALEALRPRRAIKASRPEFDALDPASRTRTLDAAFAEDVDVVIVAFGILEGEPADLHALNGTATVATLKEAA